MPAHFFVDLHCHSTIKAYARSFQKNPGVQSASPNNPTSLWHRDAPVFFDKIKNYAVGLTNFIQSDASSLLAGKVGVVCLSFYPQEKGFFINKTGTGIISDTLTILATEFGKQRIDYLQKLESYWEDLKAEMEFLRQGENKLVVVEGHKVTYSIASSYKQIDEAEKMGELGTLRIVFIPTIEGGHVFDQVMDCHEPWEKYAEGIPDDRLDRVLSRIRDLRMSRGGYIRPFFITLAHHFWNGLCGQARSLSGFVKCVVDQENGLKANFTSAGKKVAMALLEDLKDENGASVPKIFIDIKHMNRRSREQYLQWIEELPFNVPVIVSHAGVTGLEKPNGSAVTSIAREGVFMSEEINFYDDELLGIEQSGGIFGIQLDERRIGSRHALRMARGNISRRDILFAWSKLVWNQIRHIAEVLDMHQRFAWGIQALGTDFDGIIDPINGYWTSKELDDLDDYLLKHAYNYLKEVNFPCPLQEARNKTISPEELIERVMTGNSLNFLARYFSS